MTRIEVLEAIAKQAAATRVQQRSYFACRTHENLRDSKAAEAKLDQLLRDLAQNNWMGHGQQELFP